jgi:tripartite ATP-independent transporter DctP family solute receptor
MKKTLTSLLILITAICFSSQAFAAKIKFGHAAPTFHGQSAAVEAFAAYVRDKTNGSLDIATFPMSQLGNERSMASQVQSGSLQIATISTAVLQNFIPETAILDMPFIFPNRATAYAVLDDEAVQEKIFSYLPVKGFVGIGWTENEIRDFSNSKRPIHSPEDIKGLKVRVMNSPVYLDTFNQLGASTVGIPFPEVYSALQTGVIDAQENPLLTTVLMKFPEVTKYVTNTQHSLTENIIIVNPEFWQQIGPENQQILREAAKVATEVNRTHNAAIKQKLPKLDISIAEYCEQNGVEVINLTDAEREEFRTAMVPVWNKYRGIMGDEIFDFILNKVEEHKQ